MREGDGLLGRVDAKKEAERIEQERREKAARLQAKVNFSRKRNPGKVSERTFDRFVVNMRIGKFSP